MLHGVELVCLKTYDGYDPVMLKCFASEFVQEMNYQPKTNYSSETDKSTTVDINPVLDKFWPQIFLHLICLQACLVDVLIKEVNLEPKFILTVDSHCLHLIHLPAVLTDVLSDETNFRPQFI